LPAEESLVGERRVDEVPHVLVLLVQVSAPEKKRPNFGTSPHGAAV
jgi:hypothetical protein